MSPKLEEETSEPDDLVRPFSRAITDVARTSSWKRRNGCIPVGYSGLAAIRMEQCDMMAEGHNSIDRKYINC
jgi:hypothetical protein